MVENVKSVIDQLIRYDIYHSEEAKIFNNCPIGLNKIIQISPQYCNSVCGFLNCKPIVL